MRKMIASLHIGRYSVAILGGHEYRDRTEPPYAGSEKFEQPAIAEAETSIEFAIRIGDPGDFVVPAKVAGFAAGLEHVDEYQLGTVSPRGFMEVFESAEDLAGEGAAEMSEEHYGQDPGAGCLFK